MISFQRDHITVFQSALFLTNSAVIEGDGFVLVVDPTWLPQEVEEIAQHVRSIRAGRQLFLLFTHSDFDHILGYGVFPDATVIASQAFADNPNKARCVDKVREWDSEYYVSRPYDVLYPDVDIAAEQDGQQLDLGGTRLTFYSAPGHHPDGLFTLIEPLGILLAGDYLSDVEFPFIYQSSLLYESTLHKLDGILERHFVRLLIPGHGQVAITQEEMRSRQQASFDYIHSLRRYIAAENQTAIDAMLHEYAFPHGMKAFHEGNQNLMRAEAEASHAR